MENSTLNFTSLILKKYTFPRWLILPAVALVFFGLTELASRFPEVTEKWYTQKIYPVFAKILSNISSIFLFSLDDLFYAILIAGFFSLIVLLLFRKISFNRAGKITLNSLATVYILFYLFWGFNYYKVELNDRLELAVQKPNSADLISELELIIQFTSNSFSTFDNFNKGKIDSLIEDSYKNLAPVLKIEYPMGKRKAKNISLSRFFAKAGISGYYGPFFSEVHINSNNLPVEYPFVLAHEKAHQFGITSEAEANFYAWLVCTQSNSKQLQYSANLYILRYFIYDAYQLEQFPDIVAKLDDNIKADFKKIREHWMKLRNENVDKVASKVNDTYLKTNKVEKGIEDYNGVVKFVMDYSLDRDFQNKWKLKVR